MKGVFKSVGPSLAASFEPCAHSSKVDVHLNWLNSFLFLMLVVGPLVIVVVCMIFLLPFLDVIRMFITTVYFPTQLDSGILCLQNAFR